MTGLSKRKVELLSAVQQQKQLLREQNSELTKARNANADLSTKLRMIQVSYESLRDDKDIAQAAVITYEEQIFMAKEEIICKDIQIGELRNKLATVEKNSDGDNTTSTKNTASNDVAQEIKDFRKLSRDEKIAPLGPHISYIHNDDDEIKFVACETGHPDVIMNGTYIGKLEYFKFDIPDLKNTSHDECLKKEQSSQQSILENNDTKRLEDTNVRENSKDDDDVPIPSMMSAHEYHTNQLALQKKAGLAKHNA